jgi:outer membrane protein assembly factor BamA
MRRTLHIILFCFALTLLASCSIERFVPEGQHFLNKNSVTIESDEKVAFTKSEVSDYIIQSPHKVRFPNRFTTWLYYVTEDKEKGLWHWVNEHLARKPEYYDDQLADNSAKQIEDYLDNRGYFNSKVIKSVTYQDYKAKANYTIYPSKPYRINKTDYQIEDTAIMSIVTRLKERGRLPIKFASIYNAYTLDEQRVLITDFLRNMGYYYFTRDYVTFEVDSSYNDHTLSVTMKIANAKDRNTGATHPHKQYNINKISIYPNYMPSLAHKQPTDSATAVFSTGFRHLPNEVHVYYHEKPRIRPSTFSQVIQIQQGRPYRQRQVSLTYSALSNLKAFANSSIEFDSVHCDTANLLNCNIMLRRANTHSIKFQTEGTNSGGDLGISGSVTYTNRNIFRGAEQLTVSLKGGLEAQEVIDLGDIGDEGQVFNTKELIVNSSIYFPKFLSPIPLKTFAYDYQPRTSLSLGGSAQVRYAYSRYITMATFGYDWKSNQRLQFILTPFYLNYVKVNPIPEFQAVLDEEQNQRIKDQYTSHFVFGGRYSLIYNTQNINRSSNYIYLRVNFESSGGLLSLLNNTKLITEEDDHHELLGIRYSQFFRSDVDFRQYIRAGKTWFVFRQLIGVGVPYGNSYDMPFERSFYSGGSIGMRGWGYRKLGPGAYVPTGEANIERIGDIQLECNAEFRFPIYSMVNGAVFMDAGNVWNFHANELLPGGAFYFDTFYDQIAVDAGLGVRLDFKMVILRLDLAMPIRYPYPNANGNHWKSDGRLDLDELHFVFNIGYPF